MITQAIDLFIVESSINPNGRGQTLRTEWTWIDTDPLAVTVHWGGDNLWTIAAETVTEGVDGDSGIADVRIWRSGRYCRVRLSAPEGTAVMECKRKPLKDFSLSIARVLPKQQEIADEDIRRYVDEWSSR